MVERFEAGLERLREKHADAVARVEQERRAAAHAAIVERPDTLAGQFEGIWREHAEPLSAFLREVAALDEEINAANRVRLGAWLDRVETIARPGVSDIDAHKLVGLHTRLPPWDHDAHRTGNLLWPVTEKINVAAVVPAAWLAAGAERAAD